MAGTWICPPLRSSEDVWHWAKPLYATLDADKEHLVLIVIPA